VSKQIDSDSVLLSEKVDVTIWTNKSLRIEFDRSYSVHNEFIVGVCLLVVNAGTQPMPLIPVCTLETILDRSEYVLTNQSAVGDEAKFCNST
jgi:hypothetical protein